VIYELREYVAAPGRVESLHERFRQHTLGLFARHGLNVVGYWHHDDDPARIVYLLNFRDEVSRETAWEQFQADPDWKRTKEESEAEGPIVAEMSSRTLVTPSYWRGVTTAVSNG
jgi:NIPSNAP